MNSRKCNVHGEHGILYVCPEYPLQLQKEIIEQGNKFRELCRTGEMPVKHINKKGEVIWEGKLKDSQEII